MLQRPARKKVPDAFDVAVGRRVKQARIAASLTLEKLAEACDLSFQQIQKYENGTNRIAPSRLRIISQTIGIPMSQLLNESEQSNAPPDSIAVLGATACGHRLAKAFNRLSKSQRLAVTDLIEMIAK